jgi:hypothetical protein
MTHSSTSAGKLAMSVLAGLVFSLLVACHTASSAGIDYRSRMQSHNVSAAFDATSEPNISLRPTGQEWLTHIQQDLLPYWTTPVALGNPIGNSPTFRANEGSATDPKNPPRALRNLDEGAIGARQPQNGCRRI